MHRRLLPRPISWLGARLSLAAASLLPILSPAAELPEPQAQTNRWETDIRRFEASDRTNPPPRNAVLFVGSSSIRLWSSLVQDFPKSRVINRGFGGSEIADATAFLDRIVIPCRPRQIVLYAGDNDLAGGKSPEQVAADFLEFVTKVRAALPRVPIVFIAIKPSPSRWHLVDRIRTANNLIARQCRTGKRLKFVDVFTPMLGPEGEPRVELFRDDRLHLNEAGYALWTSLLRPHLKR